MRPGVIGRSFFRAREAVIAREARGTSGRFMLSGKLGSTVLSPTVPILLFVAVQTGAVALAACRIPLWARAPEATEFLALQILLPLQILASALLYPQLVDSVPMVFMSAATVWPFAFLAGLLSADSLGRIILSGSYETAFLFSLLIVRIALPPLSPTIRAKIVPAMLSTWVAAGPVLIFVAAEYGGTPIGLVGPVKWGAMGPVVGGWHVLQDQSTQNLLAWVSLAVPAGGALLARVGKIIISRVLSGPSTVSE